MNIADLKLRVSVHANGVVNIETSDKVVAFIPSRNVQVANLLAAAPALLFFAQTVARSICLDQRVGDECLCHSCVAKTILSKIILS